MPPFPRVAVVILNWNGLHHLQQFIPAVLASTYPNLEVVVADNASTDDSVRWLQQHHPDISVLRFEENLGFAGGYNAALRHVSADYYVLLNSDVEVVPGWLEPVIHLMEADNMVAAAQPKVLSFHQRHVFEYAGACGGWLDAFGYPFARGRIFDVCETDKGQYDEVQQIFWATGAAMVVRSEVFHQLKGFDEYFFAHQEEIDLCWRMQLQGYKLLCSPQSVVYHVGGGTLPRGNSRKTLLNFRNNLIMLYKNLPWSEKWWKIPFRLFLDELSAMKGLLSGQGGYFIAIVKAHLAFFYWIVFGNKKWVPPHTRRMNLLQGVYRGNLAWQHFALGKKTFAKILYAKKAD